MINRLTAARSDRYRLREEVGDGGMATVYLADDLKHGREVALKVLRPELAATMGPARFARDPDGGAAAASAHPAAARFRGRRRLSVFRDAVRAR